MDKAFRVEARGINVGQHSSKDPTKEGPNRYAPASKFWLARPGEDDN